MITILIDVLALVGAFVAGVLVGRRNKNKVEKAVAVGEQVIGKVESTLGKK